MGTITTKRTVKNRTQNHVRVPDQGHVRAIHLPGPDHAHHRDRHVPSPDRNLIPHPGRVLVRVLRPPVTHPRITQTKADYAKAKRHDTIRERLPNRPARKNPNTTRTRVPSPQNHHKSTKRLKRSTTVDETNGMLDTSMEAIGIALPKATGIGSAFGSTIANGTECVTSTGTIIERIIAALTAMEINGKNIAGMAPATGTDRPSTVIGTAIADDNE